MAKKGLGKGLGAIFWGKNVVKENKERRTEKKAKAKAEAKAAEEDG